MRVLKLVTWQNARFYQDQLRVLEHNGIDCTTLAIEDKTKRRIAPEIGGEGKERRSVLDYARMVPDVLSESLDSYDLVHANYGLTGPLALAQPIRPVVLTLWGSDLLGTFGRISKVCARFSDAVIVMSDEMAAELDQQCYVIPHGVDLEKFKPMPQTVARESVGWNPDRVHVLFPYPKDRKIKNYPLAKKIVRSAGDRMGIAIELQTTSGVPHERMSVYMNAADVLLLTSDREGSPNSVKESLACNLPIVSRDVGDVRERLEGVTRSFVCRTDEELVDALVSVIRSGGQSNGRDAARSVTLENMGKQIVEIYDAVLEEEQMQTPTTIRMPKS